MDTPRTIVLATRVTIRRVHRCLLGSLPMVDADDFARGLTLGTRCASVVEHVINRG